jgi:hypothetical protein
MPHYRVYFLDETGCISRPPQLIACTDDQEAREKAKQFIDGLDIEVWQDTRLIVKYPRKSQAA